MTTNRGIWVNIAAVVVLAGCQADGRRVQETAAARAATPRPSTPEPAGSSRYTAAKAPVTSDIVLTHAEEAEPMTAAVAATAPAAFALASQPNEVVTPADILPAPDPVPAATGPGSSGSAGGLSLPNAVAVGLYSNPDLIALRGQEGVSQAMLGVAQTYPWNPFVQAQLLPQGHPFDPGTGPGSGSGKTNYYVWVMQRFELAHQRRYREQAASAALNQVRWNIQQGELLNIAQTARLYFLALYQQDLHRLAVETAELNENLHGVVERRFAAGLATTAEVTTAKVVARQSHRQAQLAEATSQAALLALRQQLNIPVTEPLQLAERLADYQWLPVRSLETGDAAMALQTAETYNLAAELASARPDVMAACAGVMVASANFSLARAAQVPDIQSGPIYDTGDDGTKFLGLRLQMDIPVFNTGAPLARQRHAEQNQQTLLYTQLKARATLEAQTAIDRYERARRLAEASQVDLAPFAERMPRELQDVIAQFEAGQTDVLAVFATQNSLLQDRRTYLDLLNEVAQSAANVIQFAALPLERLIVVRTAAPLAD